MVWLPCRRLTQRRSWSWSHLPEHLVVLGGGYVGLEFAQMFRRFGSRVTLVQSGDQLLSHEDADVAAAVGDVLREDGIEVLLDARAVRAAAAAGCGLSHRSDTGRRTNAGRHAPVTCGRPRTEHRDAQPGGIGNQNGRARLCPGQ